MDKFLKELIQADTPKLNPDICNGIAVKHMAKSEEYVDALFKAAAKGLPEGLEYVGGWRCTAQEEFAEATRKKGTRRIYDVAKSNIFMMKYIFRYRGVDLPPRYLYLPDVGDAGYLTLGGSRFNISPILSDRVISIDVNNIFIRLLRDKLTFERCTHHFMIDNKRESVQVVHSLIYHRNTKMKKLRPTVKANCTLMHYLFCKYGFHETFQRFANCKPVVGGTEINRESYPESEWVICSSTEIKPKGCGRGYYMPSPIRVAVRKDELTPTVKNMLGGFFYVVDHFSSRILPEYVKSRRLWMILLGHIIWSGVVPEGKLHDDVMDHMISLDEYLDMIVLQKLHEIGIYVSDIYQLFFVIIENFNNWILGASDKVASMYDKELSVLYYVLYPISSAIFKLHFRLKSAAKKELTPKEIINIMNMNLKTGLIYSIIKNHGEVSTVSSSGDNKAFKITSMLVPQSRSTHLGGRKDKALISDPTKQLHPSVAEVGGYLNLPKAAPDGRSRINGHVRLTESSVIQRNPAFVELLDGIQQML